MATTANTPRPRGRSASVFIAFLAAASGAVAQPRVALHQSGAARSITLEGSLVRTTEDRVANLRVIPVTGSRAAVVLWDETDRAGVTRPYAATSLDGVTASRPVETTNVVRLRYAEFDPLAGTPGVPAPLAVADPGVYLVQFVSTPIEPMRDAVRALGGTIHRYLTDHTHIVSLAPAAAAQVAALPFVRWVGAFHPAYRLDPSLLASALAPGDAPVRVFISLLDRGAGPQQAVAERVRAAGGAVHLMLPEGAMMEATLRPDALAALAAMPQVLAVEPWGGPPGNDMDIARQIGGANLIETTLGFNGQGVRAEVMDSGLRVTHQAFQDPTPLIHGGNSSDISHGTSVYGIVFGNGAANMNGRGMLPGREQGIFASYATYGGNRYQHTGQLVSLAFPYRAVFQTNSWGNAQTTVYTALSAAMDDIIYAHDILITQSQSNTGNQNSRPEAWAKNIVSVGGIVHQNTLTRSDDIWQGASIGPASDGRVKPDLAHFYDNVLCPSSSSDTSYTAVFNGTSAATPIVGGHFGLAFQMWHEGLWEGAGGQSTVFTSRPHFTTAKALLINSAYQYAFASPSANLSRWKQGWGMPDLEPLLTRRRDVFIVNESDPVEPLGVRTYILPVTAGQPYLKVTLVYTDPMGSVIASQARINDLSLRVTSPTGTAYWGNAGLANGNWSTPGGSRNTIDTVENVFVQNPAAGFWKVEVFGDEIVQDTHAETPGLDADFALVAHPIVVQVPVKITLPAPAPTLIPPGVATTLDVMIAPGYENPVPATAKLNYRVGTSGPYAAIAMQHLGGTSYRAVIPPPSCGQTVQFYFSAAGDGGGTAVLPAPAPAVVYTASVGTTLVLHTDNFELNSGWTVENEVIQDGPWERGVPAGSGTQGDPTTDFDGSGKCWVTGLAEGSDVDGGPTRLMSPVFTLANYPQAEIHYARWMYTNELTTADNLVVQISSNGGTTWTNVESIGGMGTAWVERSFLVSSYVTPSNNIRLRFSIADNPLNSLTEAGLDAFRITTATCTNPCYADCDGSGTLTIADFGCFQTKFVQNDPYADCDGSGTLTIADFGCFQTKFVQGCP